MTVTAAAEDERPARASSLGRNAALVVVVSLIATAGSLIFIHMQQRDDRQGQFETLFTPEMRAFCEAIFDGDVNATRGMIDKDPSLVNLALPRFGSALVLAARQNQVEIANLLLDKGADLNARGQWGGSSLHWAAMVGSTEMVDLLLKRGASVKAETEGFGSTPLLWAAHGSAMGSRAPGADYIGVCEILLKAGAKVDAVNTMGEAPVNLASEPVARFLYSKGGHLAPPATRPTETDIADSSSADQAN